MIKVTDFKPIKKGALQGTFNLYLPDYDLTVRDCKWMHSNGNSWVNYPSREYEKDGQKKYFSYLFFGQEMQPKIQAECLKQLASVAKEKENDSPFI